jgi:hypothetical protein
LNKTNQSAANQYQIFEDIKRAIKNNPEFAKEFHAKGIEKAKEWHKSAEGREWHRQHAIAKGFGIFKKVERICTVCSKVFIANVEHHKICTAKCKSKQRRNSGVDNITKQCKYCSKEFETNKYSGIIYCSRKCGQQSRKTSL